MFWVVGIPQLYDEVLALGSLLIRRMRQAMALISNSLKMMVLEGETEDYVYLFFLENQLTPKLL